MKKTSLAALSVLIFLTIIAPTANADTFAIKKYMQGQDEGHYIEVKAAPGTSISGKFVLMNNVDGIGTFQLEVNDNETDAKDRSAIKMADLPQEHIGLWGTISEETITIAPLETATLEVIFNVPADAALGEYWGGVCGLKITTTDNDSSSIVSQVRNCLRIKLDVVTQAEFDEFYATYSEEQEAKEELAEELAEQTDNRSLYAKYRFMAAAGLITIFAILTVAYTQKKSK
ncbi:hypothetical protein KJ764_01205 [Patescibacteria group bacterium]|nr:hypothetical protein [Patescibacteria group bacterium]